MTDELDHPPTRELDAGSGADAEGTYRISRRHLLAAAAWTVPVILVAQATPAAASESVVSFTGTACKHPGGSDPPFRSDYHFELRIRNTTGGTPSMTITSVTVGPSQAEATARTFSIGPGVPPEDLSEKTFPVDQPGDLYIIHAGGDDSSNSLVYAKVEYRYAGVPGAVTSFTLSSGPCGDAQKN